MRWRDRRSGSVLRNASPSEIRVDRPFPSCNLSLRHGTGVHPARLSPVKGGKHDGNGRRQGRNRHRSRPRHRPRHRDAVGAGRCPRGRMRHRCEPGGCRRRRRTRAAGGRRDQEWRRRGDRLDVVDRRAEECRRDRARCPCRFRSGRHPGQQCRNSAGPDLPSHELVGLVGRARRAPQRLLQHEPCLRGPIPRAEFRRLRAHDLDLGTGRQFRPGQLHGRQIRHCRAVARHCLDMQRFACVRTASRRLHGRG